MSFLLRYVKVSAVQPVHLGGMEDKVLTVLGQMSQMHLTDSKR